MARLVRFRVLDGIAIVTLDAPPVNALTAPVRAALWEVFGRIEANAEIGAIVLAAAGEVFSAAADIREADAAPSLAQVCDRIEASSRPVVAALQGLALAGGAELALAAHYRVATSAARIGLPQVALGLIPGAGGTQRLPRIVGAELAVRMIVSTRSLDTPEARRAGLIDGLVEGADLASGAIAYAKALVASAMGPRRARDTRAAIAQGGAHHAAISQARTQLAGNPRFAPARALDCIEASALLPFDAGLAFEADALERCLSHPQSTALRHVFRAERRCDDALLERTDGRFIPVVPMGASVVERLRRAQIAAAELLVAEGRARGDIDGAMVAFGFRTGPFGAREPGAMDEDVPRRLIAAMLAEGAACVAQGAVQRPSDVDALAVHGIGFPRRHGGPMRVAQTMGLIGLRRDMRVWAEASDLWAVPDLMDVAILDANGFDAING